MVFKLIDRKECSIKKALNEKAHYVIFNNCSEVYFTDNDLHKELLDLGITDEMLRKFKNAMDSSSYELPNEINPIYHCGTLHPYYNITLMYPFFQLLYLKYYLGDVLDATAMMGASTIYFSHHAMESKESIIEILSNDPRAKNLTVYFIY